VLPVMPDKIVTARNVYVMRDSCRASRCYSNSYDFFMPIGLSNKGIPTYPVQTAGRESVYFLNGKQLMFAVLVVSG
jgi:hypothetical protein